jgi:hypothetical protein
MNLLHPSVQKWDVGELYNNNPGDKGDQGYQGEQDGSIRAREWGGDGWVANRVLSKPMKNGNRKVLF